MAKFSQAQRPLEFHSDLGADQLLLDKFTGVEAISKPFRYDVVMLAQPEYVVPFGSLLGQKACVEMRAEGFTRFFHGIVYQLSEGGEVPAPDTGEVFLRYFAQLVPEFHLLKHRTQSRIFQHLTVPEILTKVLTGLTISNEIKGTYDKRDYCAQYRESDFDFASRLMEEEGIYYYFKHTKTTHTMVLGDAPASLPDLPGQKKVEFSEFRGLSDRTDQSDRIIRWQKSQTVRSGKFTAWDYSFEMPTNHLEATQATQDKSSVGSITHPLGVAKNDKLEIYEFPGGYAQRYDGVDSGGAPQSSETGKIAGDGTRTVKLRMQQEAASALSAMGEGNCRRLIPGFQFTLDKHFSGNGSYLLTQVEHSASIEGTYTTNDTIQLQYRNRFSCLPADLPFRPARVTPRPVVQGTQTAIVVTDGDGTDISTDKYGRVKVQFFWDRDGKKNLDSSCWVRVAQPWAGKLWGAFFLPRVGHEVVVAFLEGDPDQPIIVGSVYNAETTLPYTLPDNKTRSTIKTRSTVGGNEENFNELRFEDKKDEEEIYFHAEKDFNRVVENNDTLKVGFEKKDPGDQTIDIHNHRTATLAEGNETLTVKKGNRTVTTHVDDTHKVETGNRVVQIAQGNDDLKIDMGNQTIKVAQGKIATEAMQSIELKVGGNTILINQQGITIKGTMISVEGQAKVDVKAPMTGVNADGILTLKGGLTKIN